MAFQPPYQPIPSIGGVLNVAANSPRDAATGGVMSIAAQLHGEQTAQRLAKHLADAASSPDAWLAARAAAGAANELLEEREMVESGVARPLQEEMKLVIVAQKLVDQPYEVAQVGMYQLAQHSADGQLVGHCWKRFSQADELLKLLEFRTSSRLFGKLDRLPFKWPSFIFPTATQEFIDKRAVELNKFLDIISSIPLRASVRIALHNFANERMGLTAEETLRQSIEEARHLAELTRRQQETLKKTPRGSQPAQPSSTFPSLSHHSSSPRPHDPLVHQPPTAEVAVSASGHAHPQPTTEVAFSSGQQQATLTLTASGHQSGEITFTTNGHAALQPEITITAHGHHHNHDQVTL